jgi:hypothetical protein
MFARTRGADRSGVVRQAARLIVEEVLEAEAAQEFGHDYYAWCWWTRIPQRLSDGQKCRRLKA